MNEKINTVLEAIKNDSYQPVVIVAVCVLGICYCATLHTSATNGVAVKIDFKTLTLDVIPPASIEQTV